MKSTAMLQHFIYLAGLAQVTLVTGSLAIPAILKWRQELAKVQVLIKQMFWTYAAYILVINLCFGLLSICCYRELTNGSHLAMLMTGFVAVYWISRVLIQFRYFDRSAFPVGRWYQAGEVLLITLFVLLSAVYSWAVYFNYSQI